MAGGRPDDRVRSECAAWPAGPRPPMGPARAAGRRRWKGAARPWSGRSTWAPTGAGGTILSSHKSWGSRPTSKKKMDAVMEQSRPALMDMSTSLRKEEMGMAPLLAADQPDEAKILAQIDRIAQARAELGKGERAHAPRLAPGVDAQSSGRPCRQASRREILAGTITSVRRQVRATALLRKCWCRLVRAWARGWRHNFACCQLFGIRITFPATVAVPSLPQASSTADAPLPAPASAGRLRCAAAASVCRRQPSPIPQPAPGTLWRQRLRCGNAAGTSLRARESLPE